MPRQTRLRMVVMSFRLPEALRDRLYAKAGREGVNPTEVVRRLVAEWIDED